MVRAWVYLTIAACALALATTARSEPFWKAWEGDTFPEDTGWQRTIYGGGDVRSFDNGSLVLDGRASTDIADFYKYYHDTVPGAGEALVVEWRLRVDEEYGFADPGICITGLNRFALTLVYTTSTVYSLGEGVWIPFKPGVFHDYVVTSSDLDIYRLYIDGQLAHTGLLDPTGWESGVEWGDAVQGGRSLALWDHVRFGIVPEPTAALLLGSAGLAAAAVGTSRTRR